MKFPIMVKLPLESPLNTVLPVLLSILKAPFSDSKMIIHQELMIDAKSRLYDSMLLDSSWGDIRFTNYSKYGDNPAGVVKSIQWSSNGKTYTDACILGRRGSDPRANAYCVVGQLSETDINTYYHIFSSSFFTPTLMSVPK